MGDPTTQPPSGHKLWLVGILLLAASTRLYQLQAPLTDQLYVKQVFVANKARSIARAPWNPLRDTLDFLDGRGERTRLAEEVPVYTGLVGAGYRLLGECEWIGRVGSILATLVAIVALFDLVRQESDATSGLVAALLLAACPLLIFYGRAVLPDPAMLAAMLVAACCYRRSLDRRSTRWLAATAAAGLIAALFKYYGLMVLIPLAEMAGRRDGWRTCVRPRFLVLGAVMALPVALWMAAVFLRTPNPTASKAYLLVQEPGVLLVGRLYECLTYRFFIKDCGPITAALIVLGARAALAGRVRVRPVLGWAVMGVAFFFLFAPKLVGHDYYELMMLPAAAMGGALGWQAVRGAGRPAGLTRGRAWLAAGALGAAVVVHSPFVMGSKFEPERGMLTLASRLDRVCPAAGKVVILGHPFSFPVVHYCGREGWMVPDTVLSPDWRRAMATYRARGATHVALYFDPYSTPSQRASFRPLRRALPEVEHRAGPWFPRGKPCEYYILDLAPLDVATLPGRVAARPRVTR